MRFAEVYIVIDDDKTGSMRLVRGDDNAKSWAEKGFVVMRVAQLERVRAADFAASPSSGKPEESR